MAVREREVEPVPVPPAGIRAGVSRWASVTFDSLRVRDYRVLWVGTLFTFFTITVVMTAQNVVAYDLTGNNRAVGSVMFAQGIAMLFLAPLAGAVADRMSKRFLMLLGQSVLSASFLLIGVLILTDHIRVPYLAATAFLTGVMFATVRTARNAIIGELVEPDRRGNAVALQQLAFSFMQVLGPFAAGALLAWDVMGPGRTYVLMAGMMFLTVVTMARLPKAPARPTGVGTTIFQDVAIGLRYAYANPHIRWATAALLFVTLTGMPFMTLLPGYTKEALGMDTASLGILMGVSAVGGLVLGLLMASLADSPKAAQGLTFSIALFGVALAGLGFAPSFFVAAIVMLFLGAGVSGFQMLNNAIAVRESDPAYYGRIIALTMMGFSMSSLAALPIGVLADAVGVRPVLVGMGSCVVVLAVLLQIWYSALPPSTRRVKGSAS